MWASYHLGNHIVNAAELIVQTILNLNAYVTSTTCMYAPTACYLAHADFMPACKPFCEFTTYKWEITLCSVNYRLS